MVAMINVFVSLHVKQFSSLSVIYAHQHLNFSTLSLNCIIQEIFYTTRLFSVQFMEFVIAFKTHDE